ncbi:DNA replication protein [Bacillus sp. Y1]|nr:DNA replication protein [Bacillus sp. Y1]
MTNNHAKTCLLAAQCKVAGSAECNAMCPHFISLHGMNGRGGRAATANVPTDYRMITVSNSPARASQSAVYKNIDAYVRTFERQFDESAERIKSLYLFSESPGTGKTTTAVAILNEWLIAHYLGSLKRNRQALQTPAYFLDVNEWQTLFNEFNRSNVPSDIAEPASREYYRRFNYAKHAPFVVCDDIGVRTATEAFRADLHSVINHRTANAMPTVFTSNLPIEDMAQVFDARLYDRMRDMCAVLEFGGTSKRGRR